MDLVRISAVAALRPRPVGARWPAERGRSGRAGRGPGGARSPGARDPLCAARRARRDPRETLVSVARLPGGRARVAAEAERRVAPPGRAGDDRRRRRRHPGRPHRDSSSASDSPDARKVGRADLAACAAQGSSAPRRRGGRWPSAARSASASSGRAGSAASTEAGPSAPTSPADLGELARTEALVVASGAKSLLDVQATAELLETIWACPSSAGERTRCRVFYAREGGPPVSARGPHRRGGGPDRPVPLAARASIGARCSRGRPTRASTSSR